MTFLKAVFFKGLKGVRSNLLFCLSRSVAAKEKKKKAYKKYIFPFLPLERNSVVIRRKRGRALNRLAGNSLWERH